MLLFSDNLLDSSFSPVLICQHGVNVCAINMSVHVCDRVLEREESAETMLQIVMCQKSLIGTPYIFVCMWPALAAILLARTPVTKQWRLHLDVMHVMKWHHDQFFVHSYKLDPI